MTAELLALPCNETLLAALSYCRRGWRVIPCDGKRPALNDWPARATTNEQTLREWFDRWPTANIGIVCGAKSGIVVLDVDRHGKADGAATLADLEAEHGMFPVTVRADTGGGGAHYYFKHPGGKVRKAIGFAAGLDLLGEDSVALAPPSRHPETGKPYVWNLLGDPDNVPLAACPTWLLELAAKPKTRPKAKAALKRERRRARAGDRIPVGARNDTLFRAACGMFSLGMTYTAVQAALAVENGAHCAEPLAPEELTGILDSAAKYAVQTPEDPRRRLMAKGDWCPLPNAVLRGTDGLTRTARAVLLAILGRTLAWGRTEDLLPASQLVQASGYRRGAVCKALAELVSGGWLERAGKGRVPGSDQLANRFRLGAMFTQ